MSRINVDLDSIKSINASTIEDGIRRHLEQNLGVELTEASPGDYWEALSLLVREINLDRIHFTRPTGRKNIGTACLLSLP